MADNIDLTKLDLTALKALAFDVVMERERAMNNLNVINQEIAKRNMMPVSDHKLNKEVESEKRK